LFDKSNAEIVKNVPTSVLPNYNNQNFFKYPNIILLYYYILILYYFIIIYCYLDILKLYRVYVFYSHKYFRQKKLTTILNTQRRYAQRFQIIASCAYLNSDIT